jgi:hypothetical protein
MNAVVFAALMVLLVLAWLRFFTGAQPIEGRRAFLLVGISAVSVALVLLLVGAAFIGFPVRSEASIATCIRVSTVGAFLGAAGAAAGAGKGRVLVGVVSCLIPVGWIVAVALR